MLYLKAMSSTTIQNRTLKGRTGASYSVGFLRDFSFENMSTRSELSLKSIKHFGSMYAECKYYVGGISHMMFSLKSSFRMVFIFFCLG